jgi:hypothetical protein
MLRSEWSFSVLGKVISEVFHDPDLCSTKREKNMGGWGTNTKTNSITVDVKLEVTRAKLIHDR